LNVTSWSWALGASALALAVLVPRVALACGGAFAPPVPTPDAETTVVTGNRMVYAVSGERTVLWSSLEYTGAPEDFSWVLPVRPGAYLEASTEAWFEALEAVTATRVSAPQLHCAYDDSGSGCIGCAGGDLGKSVYGSGDGGDGVTVVHAGTVGPYDTVTLESQSGDTLSAWLVGKGYVVPDDVKPIIAAYVAEGFDFIALRLAPGYGVQNMRPVRVVTPGPVGLLPLRMVAAGMGSSVAVTLYVIGEQRYALPDLEESELDTHELAFDFATERSNYADVRASALAWNLGYRYLTTFADRGALSKRYVDLEGDSLGFSIGGSTRGTLAEIYFAQAQSDAGLTPLNCSAVTARLSEDRAVKDDALPNGELTRGALACGKADDIGVALVGLHPSRTWLTRVELDLPREALTRDCVVAPSSSQSPVSQFVRAMKAENPPADCQQPLFESSLVTRRGAAAWLGMFGLALASRYRRRSR